MRGWHQSWVTFFIVVSFIGSVIGSIIFYGLIDRVPPRANIVGRGDKIAFRAGDYFNGIWQTDYIRECDGHAIRWLTSETVSNVVSYLPTEDIRTVSLKPKAIPAAGWKVPVAPFQIPTTFPPGSASYHLVVEFQCNWLQKLLPIFSIPVAYPVIPFEVLPPDSGPGG